MVTQLAFEWPVGVALGHKDFFVSSANVNGYTMVQTPTLWPASKLCLTGPQGAGKSHLARIFAAEFDAVILPAATLTHGAPPQTPVVVEDADTLPPAAEEALFHLHNNMAAAGLPLLLTARTPPARWTITLPDLASRMQATTPVALSEPDDALLQALIMKLFADRQIQPKPALVAYLSRHIERSYAAAAAIVQALDTEALRTGMPLGRKLAAQLLDKPLVGD